MSDPTRSPDRDRCVRAAALVAVLAFAGVGVSACGGDDGGTEPELPASVVVASPIGDVMAVGRTVQLTATARTASGGTLPGQSFTWSSSNQAVATVSAGQVHGLTAGNTTITATTSGVSGNLGMRVVAADLDAIGTLLVDPFTEQLVTSLTGSPRATVDAAMSTCATAIAVGDILVLQDCLGDVRATTATDPTDRALLAVLGIIALRAETLLGF